MASEELFNKIAEIGVGPRPPNDPFFDDGNKFTSKFRKRYGIYESDIEELCHEQVPNFQCDIQGCDMSFDTVYLYEQHYNSSHRFTCAQCKKTLPTAYLLDLHVAETHDSFFEIMAERQPMYDCLSEDCPLKFVNSIVRKEHCITEHKFPSLWCNQIQAGVGNLIIKPKPRKPVLKPSVLSEAGSSSSAVHNVPSQANVEEEAMQTDEDNKKKKAQFPPRSLGSGSRGGRRAFASFIDLKKNLPK